MIPKHGLCDVETVHTKAAVVMYSDRAVVINWRNGDRGLTQDVLALLDGDPRPLTVDDHRNDWEYGPC